MPASCCTTDYDAMFDARTARRQAQAYRRKGAGGTTRRLVEMITAAGVEGATVLDIGGGVEVIGTELLLAGAVALTDVDASAPYISVATHELARRGFAERATFHHGDFVELADELSDADVVTLDRVVCCYGDWRALVDRSAQRARRLYGLVYPNERWWIRAGIGLGNLCLRALGKAFRGHVHPERKIDARIQAAGFEPRAHHRGWIWQTVLYERRAAGS
jgi:SAM-dependent methyltransferase